MVPSQLIATEKCLDLYYNSVKEQSITKSYYKFLCTTESPLRAAMARFWATVARPGENRYGQSELLTRDRKSVV